MRGNINHTQALCVIDVSPHNTLVRCGESAPSMDINSFDHSSGLMDGVDLLCDAGESVVSSVWDSPVVFHRHCLQPKLSNTGLLEVTGAYLDVCDCFVQLIR